MVTTTDDLLVKDERGTIRVRDTGIRLERIITADAMGHMPAEMIEMFIGLTLSDVETILAHYRESPAEIDAYMRHYEAEGKRVRKMIEDKGMSGEDIKTAIKLRAAARANRNGTTLHT